MNMLIVFAKYPQPGKVKTRLGARISNELAADLYREFILCTFDLVPQDEFSQCTVALTPDSPESVFRSELLPAHWRLFVQEGDDLGARISHAFRYGFEQGAKKIVIIGSDSPTLPGSYITSALTGLANHDVVIGPAVDGGYYLIALNAPHDNLFSGIDWSTERVFEQTLKAAADAGLGLHELPVWYDVDTPENLDKAISDDHSGILARYMRTG